MKAKPFPVVLRKYFDFFLMNQGEERCMSAVLAAIRDIKSREGLALPACERARVRLSE